MLFLYWHYCTANNQFFFNSKLKSNVKRLQILRILSNHCELCRLSYADVSSGKSSCTFWWSCTTLSWAARPVWLSKAFSRVGTCLHEGLGATFPPGSENQVPGGIILMTNQHAATSMSCGNVAWCRTLCLTQLTCCDESLTLYVPISTHQRTFCWAW